MRGKGVVQPLLVAALALATLGSGFALGTLPEECEFPFTYKGEVHFGCMDYSSRLYCINGKQWVKCEEGSENVRVNDISGATRPAKGTLSGSEDIIPLSEAREGTVRINEVLPKSSNGVPDWIELFNSDAKKSIDLRGLRVMNKDENETFVLGVEPACEEERITIPPNGFMILFSAMPNQTSTCLTLPFTLSSGKDHVKLLHGGRMIDEVSWDKKQIPKGTSIGRPGKTKNTVSPLKKATPLRPNVDALGSGPYGINFLGGRPISDDGGNANNMRSNLPIAVVQTFSTRPVPNYPKVRSRLWISGCKGRGPFDPDEYENSTVTNYNNMACSLSDEPQLDTDIGIEVRGRSSQKFPKKQYSLELWTSEAKAESALSEGGADVNDFDYSILGMPKNADWIINGDYIDRSLIRNPLAMQIWRDFGYWAPRQAFVELFLWEPDQQASRSDNYYYKVQHKPISFRGNYQGVYAIRENIKRSKGRMNLPKLGDNATGGRKGTYILELRSVEHENLFRSEEPTEPAILDTGATRVYFKYPKYALTQDRTYVSSFIKKFESVLFGEKWDDEKFGYRSMIDVQSFIDYFFHTELTKNMDGYISSVYMTLDRDSNTLAAGPPWDYDLAFGNAAGWNGYYTGYSGWALHGPNQNKYSRMVQWYKRMLDDPYFKDQLLARWAELRSGPLHDSETRSIISKNEALLRKSTSRNFQKWPTYQISSNDGRIPIVGSQGSWSAEVDALAAWVDKRLIWMDEQLDKYTKGHSMSVSDLNYADYEEGPRLMPLINDIRAEIRETFYPNWRPGNLWNNFVDNNNNNYNNYN